MVIDSKKPTVAVFGAAGYTGLFVVAELKRRNIQPIAIARKAEALKKHFSKTPDVITRQAVLDDAAQLDEALKGAQIVINCAGPMVNSLEPLAKAALRLGIHYIDVSAEQTSTFKLFKQFDAQAKEKNLAFIPALSYFGGLADMMATALMGDWKSADVIDVMVGFDRWHPTTGTRNTLAAIGSDPELRKYVRDGKLVDFPATGRSTEWKFDQPVGTQAMTECPLTEVPLIAHHLDAKEVTSYITTVALGHAFDPNTPGPTCDDETGRAPQLFVFDVVVTRGKEERIATTSGRDGYATSATMLGEAVERIFRNEHKGAGAKAPAEFFDSADFLKALGDEVKFKTTAKI